MLNLYNNLKLYIKLDYKYKVTLIVHRIMSVSGDDKDISEFRIRKNGSRYFQNRFDHMNKLNNIAFL